MKRELWKVTAAAVLAVAVFAGPVTAQEDKRYHASGGFAAPAIVGMDGGWHAGWSLSAGDERLFGRYLSVASTYGLSKFDLNTEVFTAASSGSLSLFSGTVDVRGTLPLGRVEPYVFGGVSFIGALMEVAGRDMTLDPQLGTSLGAGVNVEPMPGLAVFLEMRRLKTLAGDAYRPLHLGLSVGAPRSAQGSAVAAAPAPDEVVGTYELERMFGQALPASRDAGSDGGECPNGGRLASFSVVSGSLLLMKDGTAFVRGMTRAECLQADGSTRIDEIPQDTNGRFSTAGDRVTIQLPGGAAMELTLDRAEGTLTWEESDSRWRRRGD